MDVRALTDRLAAAETNATALTAALQAAKRAGKTYTALHSSIGCKHYAQAVIICMCCTRTAIVCSLCVYVNVARLCVDSGLIVHACSERFYLRTLCYSQIQCTVHSNNSGSTTAVTHANILHKQLF
jgi:hypothetical protein